MIEQQPYRAVVVRDRDIDVAVEIHVAERRASAHFIQGQRFAAFRRGVHKALPVPLIADEQIALEEWVRLAALRFFACHRTVGDKQVKVAIVVGIKPVGAKARNWIGDFGKFHLAGDIHKAALAVVTIQRGSLQGKVHHKEVVVSVAIHIASGDAHPGARNAVLTMGSAIFQAGFDKPAILLVDPQQVGHAIVGDIEIQPTVTVEVRSGDAQAGAACAVKARHGSDIHRKRPSPSSGKGLPSPARTHSGVQ
ncbi:MAG: hypothetical protein U5J83_09745 [Bryobacterales bacterium]|nr:hypothetical protein [Bryobacterales bacterium]